MQTPEQTICPTGHAHVPAAQTWSPLHDVAQSPQCAPSDVRSTQAPLQALKPVEQAVAQMPLLHRGAAPPHTIPHAPQFEGSLVASTQSPPHRRVPAGHAHTPPLHTSLALHAAPQAPQSSRLLERSTQDCPHAASCAAHPAAHCPRLHAGVEPPQAAPQAPQLRGSAIRSAQAPPQATSPGRRHAPFGASSPFEPASGPGKSSEPAPPHAAPRIMANAAAAPKAPPVATFHEVNRMGIRVRSTAKCSTLKRGGADAGLVDLELGSVRPVVGSCRTVFCVRV